MSNNISNKARCDASSINLIVKEYLKDNSIQTEEEPPWIVKKSPVGGYGIFATRDLKRNEIIYRDVPVIVGPRAALNSSSTCVSCYGNGQNGVLYACKKGCGLPVCCLDCEDTKSHQKECSLIRKWRKGNVSEEIDLKLYKSLTPIRSLFLEDAQKKLVLNLQSHRGVHHGFEVQVLKNELHFEIDQEDEFFMIKICTILDANAFEVVTGEDTNQSSLRGLYPLGSLANHQCVPNTMHVFDSKRRMVVKATVDIPAGAELFHSYSRIIWGTTARRYHLKRTKHFWCTCPRCADRSEFGSNTCAIYCQKCEGLVLPIDPLNIKSPWHCETCNETIESAKVCMMTSVLSSRILNLPDDDVDQMLAFLNGKLKQMVPETNQIAIELKYRIVWILGYKDGYLWSEIPDEYIAIKENICRDLLDFLVTLGTGFCKMRGLLDYELCCCLRERRNRNYTQNKPMNIKMDAEIGNLLEEAALILREDVSKPAELNYVKQEINNNCL